MNTWFCEDRQSIGALSGYRNMQYYGNPTLNIAQILENIM